MVNQGSPTFGKVEPGFVMRQDETGAWRQELIPGSKAALEQERAERESAGKRQKDIAQNRTNWMKANKVRGDISDAMKLVNRWSTGVGGVLTGSIPSSDAKRLRGRISTIKSAVAFDTLARMRELSSSGSSGLGALSAPELRLLEDSVASLDPDSGDEELIRNFKRVDRHYGNLMRLFEEDAEKTASQAAAPAEDQGTERAPIVVNY